jgi:hypothetical protein
MVAANTIILSTAIRGMRVLYSQSKAVDRLYGIVQRVCLKTVSTYMILPFMLDPCVQIDTITV